MYLVQAIRDLKKILLGQKTVSLKSLHRLNDLYTAYAGIEINIQTFINVYWQP